MKLKIFCLVCFSAILLYGCTSTPAGNSTSDSVSAKMDSPAVKSAATDSANITSLPNADADFLKNAALGGLLEVELGKIATTNAGSGKVKAFGALMVKDHGMGGMEIKKLASSKNFTLPDSVSSKQGRERDALQKKMGKDFDKDYVNMMVDDHKDDIKEFEKESVDGKDLDVKAFAEKTLKMLHTHLDKVQALQAAMK